MRRGLYIGAMKDVLLTFGYIMLMLIAASLI
jgi:hypothetical protein